MKNLQKLQKLVASVDGESLTSLSRTDLEESISQIIDFLGEVNKRNRDEFSQVSGKLGQDLQDIRQALKSDVDKYKNDLSEAAGIRIIEGFRQRLESIETSIQARLAELKDGKDGISPEIEEVVKEIMPYIPKASTDTAEIIRNKLENLQGDERLDADAIKGLDEKLKKNVAKGGGPHALSQLMDVNVIGATNGQTLSYDATLKQWKPATGSGSGDVVKVGTPVDNQIGVWTGDGTIEGDTALTFDTATDKLSTGTSGVVVTGSIELGHATDTTITRTGAGAIAVEGAAVLLSGGALGTPSSGTLTSCTGLPVAGITASTSTALGVGSVELGHASDTTLSRSSAGVLAVEGVAVPLNSITNTHTAQQIELGHATDTTIARVSAGVVSIEGNNIVTNTSSPTLGTITTTGNIELGHASDTTIARAGAGWVQIEGVTVVTESNTATLTNKTLSSPTFSTGFTTGGTITLAENTGIALDPAGSADGKWSGITIAATAGYTAGSGAFGDIVTLDKDDSRWEKVDISVAAAATGDARGILGVMLTDAPTDGSACNILLHGVVRADANFPALTIGAEVYASTTGDIVVTQPTTTDYVIRQVGYALTADEIYFNPTGTWVTHT